MAAERDRQCVLRGCCLIVCPRASPTPHPGLPKPEALCHGHHPAGPSHGHCVVYWTSNWAANLITIWQTLSLRRICNLPHHDEHQVTKQKSWEDHGPTPLFYRWANQGSREPRRCSTLERGGLCWAVVCPLSPLALAVSVRGPGAHLIMCQTMTVLPPSSY